ncbi:MAG: amidohydrolase family protein [Deferribacteres bacterium]|nr:amidohydrolase family protein [Deferribacteres bacterium]
MHRLVDLAEEFDLPMQIHTGLQAGNGNIITNSNPTHLTQLIMSHPRVDFCLFHGGYPYGGELAVLAKNFPNVYIDMCWSAIISPSYSKRYLHEWIETVPANKILAFGGDYSVVELVYAHSVMAKAYRCRSAD